jgi:hypothetical protein
LGLTRSARLLVQVLQQLVGGQLDLLVAPFSGSVVARDDPGAVDAPEVAKYKRVTLLGLVGRAVRQTEMPLSVLLPRVRFQEGVLVVGVRLNVRLLAFEDVVRGVNESPGMSDSAAIQLIGRHASSMRRASCSAARGACKLKT